MPQVRLSPRANRDIAAALAYYRLQGDAVAERLFRAIEAAERELSEAPRRWAVWRPPELRRRLLQDFPYVLIYRIVRPGTADSLVEVLAFLHPRQDPDRRFTP